MRKMCRLECTEYNSNKFYELTMVDTPENVYQVTSEYGRIGADPLEGKNGIFPDLADADKFYAKLMKEKLKKGYDVAYERIS